MTDELSVEKEIDNMLDGIGSAQVAEEDAEAKAIEDGGKGDVDDSETDEEGKKGEEESEEEEDQEIETEEVDKGESEEDEEDLEEKVDEDDVEDEDVEEEEDKPSLKDLMEQNKLLIARVDELTQKDPKPKAEEKEEEVKDVLKDFLKEGEDIDDVVSDAKMFGEVLGRVKDQAVKEAKKDMMASIPPYVIQEIQQQQVLASAIEEFYEINEDLRSVQRTVGGVTREVIAEHSDWELEKIFVEVAKRTRTLLGMKTKEGVKKKKLRKPALRKKVKSSRSSSSSPKLTDVEKDIQDTLF